MGQKSESVNKQYNLSSDATAIEYQLESDNLAKELKKKMGLKPVKKKVQTDEGIEESLEWKVTPRSWMNEEGIENVVGIVRGYADKINQTSNYDERQIETLMEKMHQALARDLAENWMDYAIGDRGNAENTAELVTNIVWSTFNGSKGGKKMEIIGDSAETVTKSTQEQKSDKDNPIPGL